MKNKAIQPCSWSTKGPNGEFHSLPLLSTQLFRPWYAQGKMTLVTQSQTEVVTIEAPTRLACAPRPYLAKECVPFEIPAGQLHQIISGWKVCLFLQFQDEEDNLLLAKLIFYRNFQELQAFIMLMQPEIFNSNTLKGLWYSQALSGVGEPLETGFECFHPRKSTSF